MQHNQRNGGHLEQLVHIARRDNTKNPAIKAAAIRNIQSLNIQLARRVRTFGEN